MDGCMGALKHKKQQLLEKLIKKINKNVEK